MSGRRNSTLVAAGIGLSRVAGLLRERAISYFLGVGPELDAFRVAFRVPNLLQNLLGEGVLAASFIPGYSRLLADGRTDDAGRMAGAVAGLLAMVAALCVLAGVLLAEPLTALLAPGYRDQRYELTVTMMRILFPGVGLLVLSAWCLGVLNSHRRFFLSYVAPVLWNAAQVGVLVATGLVGLGTAQLAVALAWGVLAGSALQLGIQLPTVLRLLGRLRLSADVSFPPVRQALRAFVPIVAGRGVVQVMTFVEVALASLLATGAVAALGYAQTLHILPISLFGMSVAAAELPELSTAGSRPHEPVAERLRAGLARIAFFVVPTVLAFLVLGELIVGALYQTGQFGAQETRAVWLILAAFSVGLVASTSSRLLQSALYAAGDAATPARIAATRVAVAAALGAVFMLQLDQVQVGADTTLELVGQLPATEAGGTTAAPRLGAAGLALGAGMSAWLELWLLRRAVRRRLGVRVRTGGGRLARTLAAGGLAAVVAAPAALLGEVLHPLAAAPLACVATGAAYLLAAWWLGLRELPSLRAITRRSPPSAGPDSDRQ